MDRAVPVPVVVVEVVPALGCPSRVRVREGENAGSGNWEALWGSEDDLKTRISRIFTSLPVLLSHTWPGTLSTPK